MMSPEDRNRKGMEHMIDSVKHAKAVRDAQTAKIFRRTQYTACQSRKPRCCSVVLFGRHTRRTLDGGGWDITIVRVEV